MTTAVVVVVPVEPVVVACVVVVLVVALESVAPAESPVGEPLVPGVALDGAVVVVAVVPAEVVPAEVLAAALVSADDDAVDVVPAPLAANGSPPPERLDPVSWPPATLGEPVVLVLAVVVAAAGTGPALAARLAVA